MVLAERLRLSSGSEKETQALPSAKRKVVLAEKQTEIVLRASKTSTAAHETDGGA